VVRRQVPAAARHARQRRPARPLDYLLRAAGDLYHALAVGVGFGSQNLCNNFISGLILLAEQPIREGDSIQIDAFSGTVTKIGPRSTRITTGDNHEVIVPNSTFLQTNVVNRTLTDDRIRGRIKVGVAYGSPTRVVDRVLLQAAEEHEDVLDTPEPSVTFADFGDNALQFELSFWVDCRSAKGPTESDIRYRIDELFRQEGVVMAYPQRDVHLNVGQPVEVRLAGSPLSLVREFNRSAA
jgi:small-conductance mechanosensitive channel